jgi:hypothetical protein
MAQIGNKINSWLNGEWAKHARPRGKKLASHRRRFISKLIIRENVIGNPVPEYTKGSGYYV